MTRTYSIGFFGLVAAHVAVVVAVGLLVDRNEDAAWRFAVALAPMFTFVIILLMLVAQVRRLADELERRVMLEALVIAFFGTMIGTSAYGLLQRAGLPDLNGALGRHVDGSTLVRRNGRRQEAVPMKNRLRVIRAGRQWSQKDLAELLEVSRQTVNAIETGKYAPSLRWRSRSPGWRANRSRTYSTPIEPGAAGSIDRDREPRVSCGPETGDKPCEGSYPCE